MLVECWRGGRPVGGTSTWVEGGRHMVMYWAMDVGRPLIRIPRPPPKQSSASVSRRWDGRRMSKNI